MFSALLFCAIGQSRT